MAESNAQFPCRVLVIGSPGAGKSTFSVMLAKNCGVPCYHLDDLYWLSGWRRPNEKIWLEKLSILLEQEEWIIDGNYYKYLPERLKRTTFVVYLDASTCLCLYRIIMRAFKRLFTQDSLPQAVKEMDRYWFPKVDLKFFCLVLFFRLKYKPKIIRMLSEAGVENIQLKSFKETETFLRKIESNDGFSK